MIAIIDYDAGNVRSVYNALDAIGQKPIITRDPSELRRADAIVLPGVGAFGDGMASLTRLDLVEILNEEVIGKGKPCLGICLGMHFLANESEEMGTHRGLGWIDGSVRIIRPNEPKFRIPHIGWNNIEVKKKAPLFEGFNGNPVFYFVHSYHFVPEGSPSATCWHGTTVTASIQKDNIFGVQFHPEKSQKDGLKVLENFVKII
jgi:glutamine amidotransferase